MNVLIEIPIKIVSEANQREHWAKKAKRVKAQRRMAREELWVHVGCKRPVVAEPLVVTITRIAPRELDTDNLSSGCKAVRDGVADWLGVDDRSALVRYDYAQERGQPNQYRTRIQISPASPPPQGGPSTQGATP